MQETRFWDNDADRVPLRYIRGLSLTRPWEFAFLYGQRPKRIENRSWDCPATFLQRYQIALHVAQSWDEGDREFIAKVTGLQVAPKKFTPHSYIFAVCRIEKSVTRIEDVHPDQRQWFFGPFGWVVTHFVPLKEHVPCKGGRGLWKFDSRPNELAKLREVYLASKGSIDV